MNQMDEWTNERTNEWTKCMDEWTKCMDEWTILVLGVERVVADARAVQAAASAVVASSASAGAGADVFMPCEGLKKNAGAAIAAGWAAVHAVTLVPLPPSNTAAAALHHQNHHQQNYGYAPQTTTMTTMMRGSELPSRFRLHDPDDVTLGPSAALSTETLPRLLAGAVVGMSSVPTEHVLAPLRVLATLLTHVSPDELSAGKFIRTPPDQLTYPAFTGIVCIVSAPTVARVCTYTACVPQQ